MQDYIYAVHPLIINDKLVWDILCLHNVIRVYDIKLEFLVHKLPGLSIKTTMKLIEALRRKSSYSKDIKLSIVDDYVDATCFNFEHKHEYIEVSSNSPFKLKEFYNIIDDDLQKYYPTIDESELSPYDELFYRNSETPYRFTFGNLSIKNTIYLLPGKYNIPLVGDIKLVKEYLEPSHSKYKLEEYPYRYDSEHIHLLNFNNLTRCISTNVNTPSMCGEMILMAYDIETMGLKYYIKSHEIICIGMGFFHISDNKPFKRVCIISKPFDKMPEKYKRISRNKVIVYDEYGGGDDDCTTYIIVKNEEELLNQFVEVINDENPHIITTFNGFGFDDSFVYYRTKLYFELSPSSDDKIYYLTNAYLQLFSPYRLERFSSDSWFKQLYYPDLKKFELKIDGLQYKENETIISETTLFTDIYKIILKEDPKRFTVSGRGNLNSMLSAFDVKNPYNGEDLSKSGLTIAEMYDCWKKNKDIYKIALYCCQDAWICGTLMIKKSTMTDKISLSQISRTSLKDSFYRADGHRVGCCIMSYGYQNKFAVQDAVYDSRSSTSQKQQLGGKVFDSRTIVGGAVKNYLAGNHKFVVAIDYSAMYPTNKMVNNIDTSSRVDEKVMEDPERYNLKIVKHIDVNDMFGKREIFYVKKLD